MIKTLLTTTTAILLILQISLAQNRDSYFVNADPIDPQRYKDIKGSPMLFNDWKTATLYDKKGEEYATIELNYNGFTHEIEAKKNDTESIVLDASEFSRIEIVDAEAPNGKIVFKKGFLPSSKKHFGEVVFESDKRTIAKHFRVKEAKTVINDVGQTRELKSFARSTDYYIVQNGKSSILKTKKKSLLKDLGNAKQLESFIKKEKINLKSDKDLNKFFAYYETIE